MANVEELSARFEATVDEVVDVSLRHANHSPTVRRWRRQYKVMAAIVALVTIVFVVSGVYPIDRLPILFPAAVLIYALLVIGFTDRWYEASYRRKARRLFLEQYGGRDRIQCQITLRPEGLHVVQAGTEMSYPWARAEVADLPDGDIEIWLPNGMGVVRRRAFSTDAERDRFLARARELVARTDAEP